MSALAKFFVVFNLVLSLFFFGASATLYLTRYNWRAAHDEYKLEADAGLEKVRKQVLSVAKQNDKLMTDVAQYKADLANAGQRTRRLDEQLSDATTKIGLADSAREQAQVSLGEQAKVLKAAVDRNGSLERQLEQAGSDRDDALKTAETASAEANSLKLDLEKSNQDLHGLRVAMTDTNEQLEECQLRYRVLVKRVGSDVIGTPMPEIEGQIVAVDPGERLVVLSVGRDDKVEKGYRFTVFRGDEFVGKVEVFQVYPDLAGARILFTKDGSEVEQGDRASTAIN